MHIDHLELLRFRNIDRLSVELTPRTIIVEGDNAQGKTNLLEALYLCATGRSFRHAAPREMIQHGQQAAMAKARFVRHDVRHSIEVRLQPQRRNVSVDGRGLRSVAKLLELVNVVAFFPDDLRIVKGTPEERRKFLDRAVGNRSPAFVQAAMRYSRALKARNALLRQPDAPDPGVLGAFDSQLVEHGAVMHRWRLHLLDEIAGAAGRRFADIMAKPMQLSVRLASGLKRGDAGDASDVAIDPEQFGEMFVQALREAAPRDRRRGVTSVGPHRADLLLSIDGREARRFGSQGQQRSIVLALKLAEIESLHQHLATPPILLLDDVSSELDRQRNEQLFAAVDALGCQVWLSTTGGTPLAVAAERQLLRVEDGAVVG